MPTEKDFSQDANSIFPVDITKKPAEQPTGQSAAAPTQRAPKPRVNQ